MSNSINSLAQAVLGHSTLEACSLDEIKQMAQQFPYFAPAQFLLLQKLKAENSPDYQSQLQKAVLYYHNPVAFEYFINPERFQTPIDLSESKTPLMEEKQVIDSESILSDEVAPAYAIPQQEEVEPATQEEQVDVPEAEVHDEMVVAEDHFVEDALPDTGLAEEISEAPATPILEMESKTEPPVVETPEKVDEVQNLETETSLTVPVPEAAELKAEPVLSFEPYHTVDYFASQGIKLSQEEVPKDKFGRQLKSFTEWLKTMKRLPTQPTVSIDKSTEQKVEHLAEDSVHNADVVTEAMAEVWLKQGNKQKAIETYNKLSLLNPSKRAYFAALIENLKHS